MRYIFNPHDKETTERIALGREPFAPPSVMYEVYYVRAPLYDDPGWVVEQMGTRSRTQTFAKRGDAILNAVEKAKSHIPMQGLVFTREGE